MSKMKLLGTFQLTTLLATVSIVTWQAKLQLLLAKYGARACVVTPACTRGSQEGPWSLLSKCCLRFLRWILAEMCLKCIISLINFQKLPSAEGYPPSEPLNLQFWWAKVIWPNCGFSSWLWRNRSSKNQLWRHFSDVIVITSPKKVTKITLQNFSILLSPPLQSKFLATTVRLFYYNFVECISSAKRVLLPPKII